MKGKAEDCSCEDPSYRQEHYSLNSLWACWYAALAVVFQVRIGYKLSFRLDSHTLYQNTKLRLCAGLYREQERSAIHRLSEFVVAKELADVQRVERLRRPDWTGGRDHAVLCSRNYDEDWQSLQ